MVNNTLIKAKLVENLWIEVAKQAGDIFYPRLRKNKNMRLLTLTTDINFREIIELTDKNLTKKELIVAWTHSHIKKFRLETEIAPAKVLGSKRYEHSISTSSFALGEYFPFDIINLDFFSQEPLVESGRVEREIQGLEKTIKLQKDNGSKGFALIYTTLLNSNSLNLLSIITASNNIRTQGWSGLRINGYPQNIPGNQEKTNCLKDILQTISTKYGYNTQLEKFIIDVHEQQKDVCSIAGLLSMERLKNGD